MSRYLYAIALTLISLHAAACFCWPSKVSIDRSSPFGNPVKGITVEQVPVKGYDVKVVFESPDSGKMTARGELLAVGRKHIWVQTRLARRKIHRSRITSLEVVDVTSDAGGVEISLYDLDTLYQFSRYPQGFAHEKTQPEQKPQPRPEPVKPEPAKPEPVASSSPGFPGVAPKPKPKPIPKPAPKPAVPSGPAPSKAPSNCGAFMFEGQRAVWCMGQAKESWQAADVAGMKSVAGLILPYLDPDSVVPALEIVQVKASIADRWVDAKFKTHHSIAVLPLGLLVLSPAAASRLWEEVSSAK